MPATAVSQAHLPVARELSNADSLRLNEILSVGSFAVLDASALHSICSVPEPHTTQPEDNAGPNVSSPYYQQEDALKVGSGIRSWALASGQWDDLHFYAP